MPSTKRLCLSLCLALGFLCLATPAASAQLDLPRAKPAKEKADDKQAPEKAPEKAGKPSAGQGTGRGDLVPHLVCTVCYTRNYTASLSKLDDRGIANVYCTLCRRPTLHQRSKPASKGGDLDLPSGPSRPRPADPGADSGASEPIQLPVGVADERAASFILDEVKNLRTAEDSLGLRAVDSLIALGETGLEAARVALIDEHPWVCLCGARVMLEAGTPEDADRVVHRLRGGSIHPRAGVPVLHELIEHDPVRASPALLAELLDHKSTPLRNASYNLLRDRMNRELVSDVAGALASKRAVTRERAIELLSSVSDRGVTDVLLTHLADPAARVASRVVTALSTIEDESLDVELLALAFKERWVLREGSYALLALVRREDTRLEPILTESHAPVLIEGLDSTDPFVAGACATALAGIGFRSPDPVKTSWLDDRVTGRLIATVSGRTFHTDFSSLQPHALRRLRLLTGQNIGSDGPAWVSWWIEERDHFYARRAYVFVDPEEAGTLEVHVRSTGENPEVFNLIGAGVAAREHAKPTRPGELYFLTIGECKQLIKLFQSEGLFGPERLPGTLGGRGRGERVLEVLVSGRGKRFLFGAGQSEEWFERALGAAQGVKLRNLWQRYPDPQRYPNALAHWTAEAEWWASERPQLERSQRLKQHLKAWIRDRRPIERQAGIGEFERLYSQEGVPEAEDFAFFRDLLREERFLGARARRILDLALRAARTASEEDALNPELCGDLLTLLHDGFGPQSAELIAGVMQACGMDFTRGIVRDERPLMRAIATSVLVKSEDAGDVERVLELLEDPEPDVQVAAILALGEQQVEAARTELLLRARIGEPRLRVAALRSIGHLGGEFVLDALIKGRSDPDPVVRHAAVEGLCALGDPKAAPFLISLLAQGPQSDAYALARQGLVDMGEGAWPELIQTVNSPTHRARRASALILSELLVPDVAAPLMGFLTDAPRDPVVERELAILTCIDFGGQPDAALSWWDWWETVVHDDSLAWFLAALQREDFLPPVPQSFHSGGTLEGAMFLVALLDYEKGFIAENARRRLSRMLDEDLGTVPAADGERELWIRALRDVVRKRWEQ